MTIRPKVSKLTDLDIVTFLTSNISRYQFLEDNGFEKTEVQTLLSLSFYIRERIRDYISITSMAANERTVPFVLMMHKAAFPDSTAGSQFDKMTEWLASNNPTLFLASALYFLKHFDGEVKEKTVYVY